MNPKFTVGDTVEVIGEDQTGRLAVIEMLSLNHCGILFLGTEYERMSIPLEDKDQIYKEIKLIKKG